MHRTRSPYSPSALVAAVLAIGLASGTPLAAQGAGSEGDAKARARPVPGKKKADLPLPPALGEAATRAVAARYQEAEHWVQKSVTLLSLNHYWHPAGVEIVLDALRDRDRRLRAFGLETLLLAEKELLPSLATTELMQELITKQAGSKNDYYSERVLEALNHLAPSAKAKTRREWSQWWSEAEEEWKPRPWTAKPVPKVDPKAGGATVVQSVATRAFDLYHAGLDVVICIDSTGSMQRTIDASRDAIGEMLDILDGISPRMRMGLTHYKDLGDMRDGARLLMPLSNQVKAVRAKLGKLIASGGGDAPERVANGLEFALSRKMRWGKDTNKLVIIIGDAPPQDLDKAVELAKRGMEPSGGRRRGPTTGPKTAKKQRPVVTSAIAVGAGASETFRKIADAGGGAFAQINIKNKPVVKGRPARGVAKDRQATLEIVEHILTLSFGESFRPQMRAFVKIFFAYRAAGFFK